MAATQGSLMAAATGTKGKAVNDRIANEVMGRIIENSSSDFRNYLEEQRGAGLGAAVGQAMQQQAVPTVPVLSPALPQTAATVIPALNPYPQVSDPRAELLRQLGVI